VSLLKEKGGHKPFWPLNTNMLFPVYSERELLLLFWIWCSGSQLNLRKSRAENFATLSTFALYALESRSDALDTFRNVFDQSRRTITKQIQQQTTVACQRIFSCFCPLCTDTSNRHLKWCAKHRLLCFMFTQKLVIPKTVQEYYG